MTLINVTIFEAKLVFQIKFLMKFKICLEHQGSYSSVSSVISSKNLSFYDQNLGSVLAIQFITI